MAALSPLSVGLLACLVAGLLFSAASRLGLLRSANTRTLVLPTWPPLYSLYAQALSALAKLGKPKRLPGKASAEAGGAITVRM